MLYKSIQAGFIYTSYRYASRLARRRLLFEGKKAEILRLFALPAKRNAKGRNRGKNKNKSERNAKEKENNKYTYRRRGKTKKVSKTFYAASKHVILIIFVVAELLFLKIIEF